MVEYVKREIWAFKNHFVMSNKIIKNKNFEIVNKKV